MKSLVVSTTTLFVLATPASENQCGRCVDWSQTWCELEWEIGEGPCHAWGYDPDEGPQPRGEDMHIWGSEGVQLGWGMCGEEHAAPCSPHFTNDAALDLIATVRAHDTHGLGTVIAEIGNAWLEVNFERSAIQVLARCPGSAYDAVIQHVPADSETIMFWAAALDTQAAAQH